VYRFNEEKTRELVLRWQRDWDPKVLDEILTCSEPVLSGILLTRTGYPTGDFDETLNVLRARLWQKLPAFDPGRGRIYLHLLDFASDC
jgi:hypothetical protein